VLIFSQTLPMTKLAVQSFTPSFVGFGRAALSGLIAFGLLLFRARKIPAGRDLLALFVTGLCVVIGFPVLTSIALKTAAASHGAIVIGLTPLFTALFSSYKKKLSWLFWASALFGSSVVFIFVLTISAEPLSLADVYFAAAAVVVGFGYALGASLTVRFAGWQVICWALVLCLPLTVPVAWLTRPEILAEVSQYAWFGFAYVTVFSQLLGFFAWYSGLARGGSALVSQVQLLQGFFTILGSALYLSEPVSKGMWICLSLVVTSIYFSRRALRV
jgi:drug/metabolite transporter (DMT)-like permease